MKYCKICLNTDTRPQTVFSREGFCPPCVYHLKSTNINWQERMESLRNLIDNYKRKIKKKSFYDCAIGVSGGKDSLRQAIWVRDKLGLNPLLVSLTFPPEQISEVGTENISNLINNGFDVELVGIAPGVWKKLLKFGFLDYGNWCKFFELGLQCVTPRAAFKHNIPLIFWGENVAYQVGDLGAAGKKGFDGNNLRNLNTIKGITINSLIKKYGFNKSELIHFDYPSKEEFKKHNLQIIFCGWYWKDWSIKSNALFASLSGMNVRPDSYKITQDIRGVFSMDEDWLTLAQMIKYYKFGFGRVTDYMNEDIRNGLITREKAIPIVKKYDSACGEKYIKDFSNYVGITVDKFWSIVRKFTNKELFKITNDSKIIPRFEVGKDYLV